MITAGALPASAKPPLNEVAEIHDGLLALGIADELRNTCDSLGARMLRATKTAYDLQSRAKSLGYSSDEIDDYVTSKAEKKKMRAEGEVWLKKRGVTLGKASDYCRVGREEIAKGSSIGVLLWEK